MEGKELNLNKDPGGGYNNSKSGGDGFIDRSKVKILLCDNDSKSSEEVFTLLLKCSYQVISVKSARQVIDALNVEGPDIDIILAEVDLPKAKGMKMLKYITRDKDLQRIPVIMMSTQDEVSIVVKCLRLGAADYLVKPLRTNELLNLWTHMWRRRHMLGLTEKNILNYDLDVVVSDPSDANTNSTTLLSDDTDDKSRRATNPEIGISTNLEEELVNGMVTVAAEPLVIDLSECRPNVPGISDRRTGQLSCGPKKSELKIGESSAFFTYVKASTLKKNSIQVQDNGPTEDHSRIESTQHHSSKQQAANDSEQQQQLQENPEAWDSYSQGEDLPSSSSLPDSLSMERSCTPPTTEEKFTPGPTATSMHPPTGRTQPAYPFHMPGVMNPLMVPPQYSHHHLHHYPHGITQMTHFPFYSPMLQQPSQMPNNHHPHHPHNLWPSFGSSSSGEVKVNKVDRREAALMKFRQKRKERCFDKKIRYVNRKRLAERRPRVRGQFVRKVNGVNVDLNGQPASADEEDEDDDEESRG